MIQQFHFLRPWWLLALFALAALLWLLRKYRFDNRSWREVIDPRLLPFLLSGGEGAQQRWLQWWLGLVGLLAIEIGRAHV